MAIGEWKINFLINIYLYAELIYLYNIILHNVASLVE